MINLIYTLMMLFGIWVIAYLFYEYKRTKHRLFYYMLPIALIFWGEHIMTHLIAVALPEMSRHSVCDVGLLIGSFIIVIIPWCLQYILGKHNIAILICFGGLMIINSVLVSLKLEAFLSMITGIIYAISMLSLVAYGIYLYVLTRTGTDIRVIFCRRFLMVSLIFIPGIVWDILRITVMDRQDNFFLLTSLYFTVFGVIVLTLPKQHPNHQGVTKESLEYLENQYRITKREQDVIREILNGKSNKDIAEILYISLNTVKRHLLHVFEKMQVKSRFELIKKVSDHAS